jgi:hypothetical protein
MGSWTRRRFDGIGLTQYPPGRHLDALQARYGGTVWLCIDVSWSMRGRPLDQAIQGGERFVREAVEAGYRCGLVLWTDRVARYVPPTRSGREAIAALRKARVLGRTNLVPTLRLAKEELAPLPGDRVLCVFGDGHVGRRRQAAELARELCALGVRIIVRGFGADAAQELAELACPGERDDHQLIEREESIGAGIASMATGLAAVRRANGG